MSEYIDSLQQELVERNADFDSLVVTCNSVDNSPTGIVYTAKFKEQGEVVQTSHNSDYKKFSGSDIKNAFISGYEQGHNDTVESCYGSSEDKAVEYLEEPENFL